MAGEVDLVNKARQQIGREGASLVSWIENDGQKIQIKRAFGIILNQCSYQIGLLSKHSKPYVLSVIHSKPYVLSNSQKAKPQPALPALITLNFYVYVELS